ncbi:MAG: TraX family protein [Pseudomonadota bacterium]
MKRFPGIELVKWLGLAAMVYDHVDAYSTVTLPLASHVGAVAFPFFVYAMFAALADAPAGKVRDVVRRMFAWAVVAQIAVLFVRDGFPLNVLFTLAAALAVSGVYRLDRVNATHVFLALPFVLIALLAEFSLAGLLFALVVAGEIQRGWSRWWTVAAALPLFAFNELSFAACAAAIAASIISKQGPSIGRIPRIFYPLYVVQWPLLRLL